MKQRLQVARELVNDLEVVFLDEPTLGLDVNIATDIHKFIREKIVNEQGKTVLLTTHYIYEAEEICDRIGFLNKAELVTAGRPEELKREILSSYSIEVLVTRLMDEALKGLRRLEPVNKVTTTDYEKVVNDEKVHRLIINADSDAR